MSEKRFTWDGDILFDSLELREFGNCLEARDIADLLNDLNDENEQLKEEIRAYPINEQYAEEIIQQNQKLRIERNDLRIENKKLRKELDNFRPVMFQDMRKGTVILYSKGDSDE